MSVISERIRGELAGLSEVERAELAHFLIQSLDQTSEVDAESAWDLELERRAKEIEGGRATGESAEKVFSELRAKYS